MLLIIVVMVLEPEPEVELLLLVEDDNSPFNKFTNDGPLLKPPPPANLPFWTGFCAADTPKLNVLPNVTSMMMASMSTCASGTSSLAMMFVILAMSCRVANTSSELLL